MADNKPPSFQWYPKDCDTDEAVRMMNDTEYGFYGRCLNHAWLNDGIPGKLEDIARALGRTEKYVERIWLRVGPCFPLQEDGRRRNPKQEEYREKVLRYRHERSESGSAGAQKRWRKSKNGDGSANGSAMEEPMAKNSSAYSVLHTPIPDNPPKPPDGGGVLFELPPIEDPPFNTLDEELDEVAKRIHKRHPARKCSLEIVKSQLRKIIKSIPEPERIACLHYVDQQHVTWCESWDWSKDGGAYAKGLEAWLNPKHRLWENEPVFPKGRWPKNAQVEDDEYEDPAYENTRLWEAEQARRKAAASGETEN